MFPEYISSNIMSLTSNVDKFALSLGVQLHPNGTIDTTSIIVTPSLILVNYRLTYDEVNEMLDEGVGYTEEWEIGTLLSVARTRRAYRISRGSTEGMVPFPIPKSIVTATKKKENDDDDDEYDISLTIETTHNSGVNTTTTLSMGGGGSTLSDDVHYDPYCSPISSSQLIVTEMMILGESK
jgi:exoribonuclease R